jgi:Ca2+/Na+ antiporter
MTVYFTTDIVNCIPCLRPAQAEAATSASGAGKQRGKMHGVEVEVEEILHGRMADAHNAGTSGTWNFDPTNNGMYAEPVMGHKRSKNKGSTTRGSIGFQLDGKDSMLGNMLRYKDLAEVVILEMGVIELQFIQGVKHVTLRLTVADETQRDTLLKNIETYSLGRPYIHKYDPTVVGAFAHFVHTLKDKEMTAFEKLCALPEFAIDVALKLTLFAVDVKDVRKQGRWMACFGGAMFWLAIFSWMMLEIANQIHYNIPALPNAFLGITVCAIGTSFPNAVASILMAQQDKPAAAIANALGSNVQNVFLAMALPWVIFLCQTDFKPIEQNVEGITEGVFWMMGTLVLVIFFVLVPPLCSLVKSYGYILTMIYVVYLVLTSGETFGWWPPLIK